MGIFDYFKLENRAEKIKAQVVQELTDNLIKASTNNSITSALAAGTSGAKRYQFSQEIVNGVQTKKKPGAAVSFQTLRQFSIIHEISRACINARKRQISGLEWAIVAEDTENTEPSKQAVKELETWFKNIGGQGLNYRKFINRLVEDLLVLDAVSLEKQFARGGKLLDLIPIDAATIRLRVDQSGATPTPPEVAYKQIIRGAITAEWTTDEMIYDMMNPRNDSPYGLAPLESLIIIVSSSLKAGTYNLAFLTEGNIPEGFLKVPENWTPQMIKEFSEYWDAMIAGDDAQQRKLKVIAGGSGAGYEPTRKPTDMAFKDFNDWLLKIACAMFDVQPQEIGFSPNSGLGGKGFAEEQNNITNRKSIMPMVQFIQELFTNVIQNDLGYADLCFKFQGLEQKDAKLDAETNEILIRSGQRTIDEIRTDDGLTPIGVDKPFVIGNPTFIDEESINAKQANAEALQTQLQSNNAEAGKTNDTTTEEDSGDTQDNEDNTEKRHIELVSELRTFRKYAINRIEKGKTIRKFESNVLPTKQIEELNVRLQKATDKEEVRSIFKEYMDDYNVRMIQNVLDVRKKVADLL